MPTKPSYLQVRSLREITVYFQLGRLYMYLYPIINVIKYGVKIIDLCEYMCINNYIRMFSQGLHIETCIWIERTSMIEHALTVKA